VESARRARETAGRDVAAGPPTAASAVESPLVAWATDGRIRLRELKDLPGETIRQPPHAITQRLPDGGVLHVFGIGAVVALGGASLEACRAALEQAIGRKLLDDTRDAIVLRADPRAVSPRIEGDRVVVPRLDDAAEDTAAFVLAHSVALERYESRADAILDDALALAGDFAVRGRPPGRHPQQIRRIARLALERLELARWFFPLDRPDWSWDQPAVAHLYDALADELELADRHAALLHKLESVEGTVRIVIELWDARRNRVLEWAIVLLIVLEIALALAHAV
jgi:uncharacterized Rmd1/YagE family protein